MIKIDTKTLIAGLREKGVEIPSIERDKKLHFALGLITVVAAVVICAVWQYSPGFAVAVATTAVGVGMEAQQKIRGEGDVSVWDAAFTAAPGYLFWAGWEAYASLFG